MKKDLTNQTRAIAADFVEIWHDHYLSVHGSPLEYLDYLMDEAVRMIPTTRGKLAKLLTEMVPGMHRGTALRLVRLKYPHVEDTGLIEPLASPNWG